MIFTGRLLSSDEGISFWQEKNDAVTLHFVTRGIVIDLSVDEVSALARASTAALAAAQTAEDEKDRTRRLQILQARVNDYVRRERAARIDDGATED